MAFTYFPNGLTDVAYTERFDYDVNGNVIYHGYAISLQNPQITAPVWAIQKYTYGGSNQVILSQWAGGNNNFAQIWNNRTTLSYY